MVGVQLWLQLMVVVGVGELVVGFDDVTVLALAVVVPRFGGLLVVDSDGFVEGVGCYAFEAG